MENSLSSKIKTIYKHEWLILNKYVVITKNLLECFMCIDDELVFVQKVNRLKIPIEKVSKLDKRLFTLNDISSEIKSKPNKSEWHIMKTKDFKKAIFMTGSTRQTSDLRKFYLDMEDVLREYMLNLDKNLKQHEMVESAIEKALSKYTDIIDDKILSRLTV